MAITQSMSRNDTTSPDGAFSAKASTQRSGQLGEELAARFLQKNGLTVLTRNYRCRGGEIDLICRHGKSLVFVEVRLRRSQEFGGAAASITRTKQRRLILAAQHYLTTQARIDSDCRFDCVLLAGTSETDIEWVRDAFSVD